MRSSPADRTSITPTCCAPARQPRCWPSGDGALDVGHVPAVVHVRPRPPTRSRHRPRPGAGLGSGRRPGRRGGDDRYRLDDLRGRRQRKQGAAFGYTKVLGYHPILATRADTGEILHARMRKGSANTQRGARRFIDELVARVRRAGAAGQLTMRVDSGFWPRTRSPRLTRLDVRFTMAVRCGIHPQWRRRSTASTRTPGSTSTTPTAASPGRRNRLHDRQRQRPCRLVVRRTRLTGRAQQRLWPDWRHHAFLTDLDRRRRRPSTSSTATTPPSSSRSATSRKAPDSSTSRPAGSSPTRRGCNAPCSPTTSPAGPPSSATIRVDDQLIVDPHHPHPTPRPARPARQPLRATDAAHAHRTGRGPSSSSPRSTRSATCEPASG